MLSRVLAKTVSMRMIQQQTFRAFAVTANSPYQHGKFRSNAQELISKVPVIEVADHVAVCDGGSGALGHPLEHIQLDTVSNEPQNCKYCGLRYKMKHGAHHH